MKKNYQTPRTETIQLLGSNTLMAVSGKWDVKDGPASAI